MPDWTIWMVVAGGVAAFLVVKRLTLISAAKAREALNSGGIVVDVRSKQEFAERHLPDAINIPLDELRQVIARTAPDKSKPVLLHCLSGGRSGVARLILKRMGYGNAFNLGSYARAKKIVGA